MLLGRESESKTLAYLQFTLCILPAVESVSSQFSALAAGLPLAPLLLLHHGL